MIVQKINYLLIFFTSVEFLERKNILRYSCQIIFSNYYYVIVVRKFLREVSGEKQLHESFFFLCNL